MNAPRRIRRCLAALALLGLAALPVAAGSREVPDEVGAPARVELGGGEPGLALLQRLKVDVDGVFDGWARVYVTPSQAQKLRRHGFHVTTLPNPEREAAAALRELPPPEKSSTEGAVSTVYHTYTTLTTGLQAIAAAHPDIARLFSVGQSVQGRELWMMKLSDNPDVDEDEPEVSFISSMHGDEVVR